MKRDDLGELILDRHPPGGTQEYIDASEELGATRFLPTERDHGGEHAIITEEQIPAKLPE